VVTSRPELETAGNPTAELLLPPVADGDAAAAQIYRLHQLVTSLIERNDQLQTALDSRVVIEQAKGVLAVLIDCGVDESFDLLRRAARSNRIRLHDLADTVVRNRAVPASVAELLASD
jgi:hypothetical protein